MKTTNQPPMIIIVLSFLNSLTVIDAPVEKFRKYLESLRPSKNFNKYVRVVVSTQYEELEENEAEPTLDIALSLFAKIILDFQTKKDVFETNYDPIVSSEFEYKDVAYVFVLHKNFEDGDLSLILIEASNVQYFTHRKIKVCLG